jgi:hypothetical protein
VIKADHYPASQEALKIAALLPSLHARPIFRLIEASPKRSFKKLARKLGAALRARAKKFEALVQALHPGAKLIYTAREGIKEVRVDVVDESTFEETLGSLLEGRKENRGAFKAAELIMYGRQVVLIDCSTLLVEEVASEDEGLASLQAEIEIVPKSLVSK